MMRITETTSMADLLLAAKTALRDVESGELFTVRDLFRGFEWNRISVGKRSRLGGAFNEYVKDEEGSQLVEDRGKNSQHQQQYLKK